MSDDPSPRPADVPAGFDEEDPYADVDLEEFPEWWRENVRAFREHDMRPYRPPQFEDGTLVPELVASLESELDAEIRLRKHIGPDAATTWRVSVDGETAGSVDRVRNEEGRSVYSVPAEEFERLVRETVDGE